MAGEEKREDREVMDRDWMERKTHQLGFSHDGTMHTLSERIILLDS